MAEDSAPEDELDSELGAPAEQAEPEDAGEGEDEDGGGSAHPGRSKLYWIIIAFTGLIGALIPVVNKVLPDPVCVKGETQACTTPVGPGVQRCHDDGEGWGECASLQTCKPGWFERCETEAGEPGDRGCTAEGRWGPCEAVAAQVCSFGDTQTCEVDGGSGVERCLEDGSGWDECKPLPVCSPGETRPCSDGGRRGRQTCEGDGSGWSACESVMTKLCVAGETRSCMTSKGAMGTQRCAKNRKRWSDCRPKQICSPGQKSACSCPSDAEGWRTCSADGTSYGACECAKAKAKPWCEARKKGGKVVACAAHGGALCVLEGDKCLIVSKQQAATMKDAHRATEIRKSMKPVKIERGG